MNAVILRKKISQPLLAILVFACPALLPQVQALSPTPDGCYSNLTTAEGCGALKLLTTGAANTALGSKSSVHSLQRPSSRSMTLRA